MLNASNEVENYGRGKNYGLKARKNLNTVSCSCLKNWYCLIGNL